MKNDPDSSCFPVKNILIAEDDIDDQDFITAALLQIDKTLSIQTVITGNHVLTHLETLTDAQMPHLIILDYNLPELDGADILQRLTQNPRYEAIPKIIWSTSNSPHSMNRSMQEGAALYLVKPCTLTALEDLAREMLSICQARA